MSAASCSEIPDGAINRHVGPMHPSAFLIIGTNHLKGGGVIGLSLHAFEGIMRADEGDEAEQQADQEGEAQYCDGETQEYYGYRPGRQPARQWYAGCGRARLRKTGVFSATESGCRIDTTAT